MLTQENPMNYHSISTPEETRRPAGVYKCPECKDTMVIWRTPQDKYKMRCTKCNADMQRVGPPPTPVLLKTFALSSGGKTAFRTAIRGGPAAINKLKNKLFTQEWARSNLKSVAVSAGVATGAALGVKGLIKHRRKRGRVVEKPTNNELDELTEIYRKDPERARLSAAQVGVPYVRVVMHYGKGSALTGMQLGIQHGKAEAAGTRSSPGAIKLAILQLLHGGSYVIGRQHGLSGKHGGTRSIASATDILPTLSKRLAGVEI